MTDKIIKEFRELWLEIFNADFLIRDWDMHGRSIERLFSKALKQAEVNYKKEAEKWLDSQSELYFMEISPDGIVKDFAKYLSNLKEK